MTLLRGCADDVTLQAFLEIVIPREAELLSPGMSRPPCGSRSPRAYGPG